MTITDPISNIFWLVLAFSCVIIAMKIILAILNRLIFNRIKNKRNGLYRSI